MVNVFLVASEDEPGEGESVLEMPEGNPDPYITGDGDVTVKCGNCKHVLARKLGTAAQVSQLVLRCPMCRRYNRTRT